MLLQKDDETLQSKCKDKLTEGIKNLLDYIKLPYYIGEKITQADVLMAPYFDRLCVLKHYRKFEIPDNDKYEKFHLWRQYVLNHKAVKPTRLKEEQYIKVFEKYANGTIRNDLWKKYMEGPKPKWLTELYNDIEYGNKKEDEAFKKL